MSKSSILKKLFFFIRPTSVFTVFKIINFILKLFGLYPFKIERTKKASKPVICLWGVILTTIHFIGYFYCYIKVLCVFFSKHFHGNEIYETNIFTFVDIFGANLLLIMEGLTVFVLFLNVLITTKAQRYMISLFNLAENQLKDEELNHNFFSDFDLLKLFVFSLLLFINLFGSFLISFRILLEIYYESVPVNFVLARILPRFYIHLKTSQFVLYTLMFHFMFNDLNNVMNKK